MNAPTMKLETLATVRRAKHQKVIRAMTTKAEIRVFCWLLVLGKELHCWYMQRLRLAEKITKESLQLDRATTNSLPAHVRFWRSTEGLDLCIDYALHPICYWPWRSPQAQDHVNLVKRNGRYVRASKAPSWAYGPKRQQSLEVLAEQEYSQEERDYQI
jgi:hypothetical protein